MIRPGFYRGRLWHRRHAPAHAFTRDLLLACADVDAIDAAPGRVLRLAGRWPITFRRKDHLPEEGADASAAPGRTLRETVTDLIARRTGRTLSGPMHLVSQPRCFGLTFDPVSFVYCSGPDGLEAVVAEVTNTPWGERHVYLLDDLDRDETGRLRFDTPKALHVSPFFEMDHDYRFTLREPDDRLRLSITNRRGKNTVFEAGFEVRRVGGLGTSPRGTVLRHAFMPYETLFGIYTQAARLAWKRAPFHPHPSRSGAYARSQHPPLDSGGTP
ncbi:MAG: DUF1365 domain-containing protein [Myxococcota bacterium]